MPYNGFHDLENASVHIFSFIDQFYNCKKIHSYLGYVNPDRFEYENSVEMCPTKCHRARKVIIYYMQL